MNVTFPNKVSTLVNLILQRTEIILSSGYDSVVRDWSETGDLKGLEKLASNQDFVRVFLQKTCEQAKREADIFTGAVAATKKKADSIVSIGCGNGLIELFVISHLKPSVMYLIDIEETPGLHKHGVGKEGAGYSSLSDTYSFLKENLSDPPTLVTINPKKVGYATNEI